MTEDAVDIERFCLIFDCFYKMYLAIRAINETRTVAEVADRVVVWGFIVVAVEPAVALEPVPEVVVEPTVAEEPAVAVDPVPLMVVEVPGAIVVVVVVGESVPRVACPSQIAMF